MPVLSTVPPFDEVALKDLRYGDVLQLDVANGPTFYKIISINRPYSGAKVAGKPPTLIRKAQLNRGSVDCADGKWAFTSTSTIIMKMDLTDPTHLIVMRRSNGQPVTIGEIPA